MAFEPSRKLADILNFYSMLKHNLKVFLRSIILYKTTFLLNLIGLSTGLTCVILISLWVIDEIKVDSFHTNDQQLYQIWNSFDTPDGPKIFDWTPPILARTMVQELPEVIYATAQTLPNQFNETPLTVNGKITKASGIFAEKDYFKIFTYPLLEGNVEQVLSELNNIVISESLARLLFGTTENVIGKTISWDILDTQKSNQVSGIFKDIPSNSTTRFDFILPFKNWEMAVVSSGGSIDWVSNAPLTYVVLNQDVNVKLFSEKIKEFSKLKDKDVMANLIMTQYSSNYLYGNFDNGKQTRGRMDYVYLFSLIALFILMIACINFMNLSTANATRRFKEIGVKKAMGSSRIAIMKQYFTESVLSSFLAFGLAIVLTSLFLPKFNEITEKSIEIGFTNILTAILIVLITGILAGSYPAIYLSGFTSLKILKGNVKGSRSEARVRRILVVFQFAVSIVLIISVLVVYQQITYVQSKNLGMNKDNIVYFNLEGDLKKNTDSFIQEIKAISGVVNAATTTQNIIGTYINETAGLRWSGNEEELSSRFNELRIGHDFIETMGMKISRGRTFSRGFPSDSFAIVLNQTAIDKMRIEDPIGKIISYGGKQYSIIGILEDFHFKSLREKVGPMFFRLAPVESQNQFIVRLANGKEKETLGEIEQVYNQLNKGYNFNFSFLDTDFQSQYKFEKRAVTLAQYFAVLAILICCLGLFGLAMFTAERRKKEIGIRKVLGQNNIEVILMLSGSFIKLVFISILIALPISYYLTNEWLSDFAYRIPLSLSNFLVACTLGILIAALTVSGHAVIAANQNPADVLRDE